MAAGLMAVGLACILSAGCGRGKGKGFERTHGTVREIDVQARTLNLKEKVEGSNTNETIRLHRTYKLAFDCRIKTATKEQGELSDLKIGDRINVNFSKEGDVFVAHEITPRGLGSAAEKEAEKK